MSDSLSQLFHDAVKLDASDRAALAGLLIESLDPVRDESVEALWAAEVGRRLHEIDQGAVQTIAWNDLQLRLASRGRGRGQS